MKVVLALCCLTVAAVSAASFDRGASNSRLFGGYLAYPGQFPHQVSIRLNITGKFVHNCGGSIITDRLIVTAAHCFVADIPELNRYRLVLGAHNNTGDGETYLVQRSFVHPGWDVKRIIHDIALAQTERLIRFSELVQPIPIGRNEILPGNWATTSGWGLTDDGVTTLKYANVLTMSNDECRERYAHVSDYVPIHDNSTLCAFSGRKGTGVCSGDSGGPLVHEGWLIGVTSWAHPCARGDPDGFCRISEYVQWIDDTIAQAEDFDIADAHSHTEFIH